jgi:hypothetical protein
MIGSHRRGNLQKYDDPDRGRYVPETFRHTRLAKSIGRIRQCFLLFNSYRQ